MFNLITDALIFQKWETLLTKKKVMEKLTKYGTFMANDRSEEKRWSCCGHRVGRTSSRKRKYQKGNATYWNGFSNLKEEDASTYTDEEIHGLDELGLIVFFPEKKPYKESLRLDRANTTNKEDEYRGLENYYEDKNI